MRLSNRRLLVALVAIGFCGCGSDATTASSSAAGSAKPSAAKATSAAKSAPPPTPQSAAPSAAPAASSAGASASASAGGDNPPTGKAASADALKAIAIPAAPAFAPKTAKWVPLDALNSDGNFIANLKDGDKNWIGFQIYDCRNDGVKEKAAGSWFEACVKPQTEQWKGHPVRKQDANRAIRVGNVVVQVTVGADAKPPPKGEDIEKFMEGLDLAALEKL